MSGATAVRVIIAAIIAGATATSVVVALTASGGGDVGRHVLITSPAPGAEVVVGQELAVTGQGFDPRGVRRWEVLAAGEVVASDDVGDQGPTHVPIDVSFRPDALGPLLIEVRVTGQGDRQRPAGSVLVTVIEEGLTTTTDPVRTTTTDRSQRTTTSGGGRTTTTTLPTTTVTPDGNTVPPTTAPSTAPTTAGTTPTSRPTVTTPTTAETTTTTISTTTTEPDTNPPRVTASSSPPPRGGFFTGDQITFVVSAVDDQQLVVVEVWIQEPGANQPSLARECTSSPCSHTLAGRPGTYTYFGIARDAAGNQGTSARGQVQVNAVPG